MRATYHPGGNPGIVGRQGGSDPQNISTPPKNKHALRIQTPPDQVGLMVSISSPCHRIGSGKIPSLGHTNGSLGMEPPKNDTVWQDSFEFPFHN